MKFLTINVKSYYWFRCILDSNKCLVFRFQPCQKTNVVIFAAIFAKWNVPHINEWLQNANLDMQYRQVPKTGTTNCHKNEIFGSVLRHIFVHFNTFWSTFAAFPQPSYDFTTKLRITIVRTRKLSTEYWEFQKLRRYFHRIIFSRWLQVFQKPESPNMRNP